MWIKRHFSPAKYFRKIMESLLDKVILISTNLTSLTYYITPLLRKVV